MNKPVYAVLYSDCREYFGKIMENCSESSYLDKFYNNLYNMKKNTLGVL